jgi:hypothetical protein
MSSIYSPISEEVFVEVTEEVDEEVVQSWTGWFSAMSWESAAAELAS